MALLGCATLPSSIPNEAGAVTEDVAGTLLAAGSPDLPITLWIVASQLLVEDFRECPKVYTTGTYSAQGFDCIDSSGITWSGSMSATVSGSTTWLSFSTFGPTGIEGGWVANGQIGITPLSGGYAIDTKLQLDSWDGEPQTWWIDTEMGLGTLDSVFYAEHYNGTIGLQDWGLADIDGNNVYLALPMGCTYASHPAGNMALTGDKTIEYTFSDGTNGPPVPPVGGDTGFDTGPYDTDTGDTGDTSDSDSGDSGIDSLPTASDEFSCGICTSASIDGEPIEGCIGPERTVAFPFPLL